ncbi:hypothetical protein C7212DRAFT_316094 [Tuber magnatum]|uniref:Uncharacterized protein n=1 Tax=Tuber magnatum TaxID=42249 RepID=A0A317SZ67_9PEZI|nr:hypothetical protein C7212DRAFT_316094 [Tuber magnatum]
MPTLRVPPISFSLTRPQNTYPYLFVALLPVLIHNGVTLFLPALDDIAWKRKEKKRMERGESRKVEERKRTRKMETQKSPPPVF